MKRHFGASLPAMLGVVAIALLGGAYFAFARRGRSRRPPPSTPTAAPSAELDRRHACRRKSFADDLAEPDRAARARRRVRARHPRRPSSWSRSRRAPRPRTWRSPRRSACASRGSRRRHAAAAPQALGAGRLEGDRRDPAVRAEGAPAGVHQGDRHRARRDRRRRWPPTAAGWPPLAPPVSFTVGGPSSVLRLQQLLAETGYLPLRFVVPSGTGSATAPAITREPATLDLVSLKPISGAFSGATTTSLRPSRRSGSAAARPC